MNLQNFKKFLVIDTETESLSLFHSRPWQVSYMTFDHSRELEVFDRFPWWEDLNVGAKAAEITKFNYEDYKSKAEDATEVFDHFYSYLNNPEYGIVGQNHLQFDVYQIKTWAREIGRKVDWSCLDRFIDTNALSKAMKSNTPIDKDNFLFWQYKILGEKMKVKTSQGVMLKEFEIPHDPFRLHDGVYDIQMTKELFYKLRYLIS